MGRNSGSTTSSGSVAGGGVTGKHSEGGGHSKFEHLRRRRETTVDTCAGEQRQGADIPSQRLAGCRVFRRAVVGRRPFQYMPPPRWFTSSGAVHSFCRRHLYRKRCSNGDTRRLASAGGW